MFVQLFFNLVIYEYSFFQSNFYKNLVALHSYLKQTRLINGQRVTRPTCLLCLAQLLANTLNYAHTHTLHTQQGSERNTPARNTAPCIDWTKKHFLLMVAWPPFHLKILWSCCIAINRPTKRRGLRARRTRLQVLCLWPAHQPRWQP